MEPIAIIGIGCRFADAANPEAFFELLKNGLDATREVPEDRWSLRRFYDPDRRVPGKVSTSRGGFLPQIDGFDAHFFGISPREAACMDPQQRLMLEVSWEAMEDAGLVPERLAGADVGVFVGAFTLDYKAIQLGFHNRHLIDAHTATGAMMTMISNRISYVFDFRGPSMSIDTACSSSLVAIHLACQSIRNEECSIALAGGVNVMAIPEYTVAESKGGFLAPDGRSKPFSASADGYGRAEGAGVVLLKPLSSALSDGDPIYAVIRGSAVNQDGHTNGITVPSGAAQERLIREACRRAGVLPGQIQYVEAHGTGTPVGDPIEMAALAAALGEGRAQGDRCIVGSVKGNIGHLEAGAGVAGVIKTVMCLRNRLIPPNLHFDNPNPNIPFDELPVRVPDKPEAWPEGGGKALAGVNSFGFGGTNAHVVIEESPQQAAQAAAPESDAPARSLVFPISARSPQALDAMTRSMRDCAAGAHQRGIGFADMYYSAALRRSHHDYRLGVVAGSSRELARLLEAHLAGEPRAAVAACTGPVLRPRVVFVCTGMGPQWWAMGRQLFSEEHAFRDVILRCDEVFRKEAEWSLLTEMMAGEMESRMADTQVAQTANFAIQAALGALWKSWGIEPDAVVGHSVGEVSAAFLSGALSLEDAIRVSFHRSRLQQTTAGSGAMMAVGLPAGQIADWLLPYNGRISIAAVNSPSSATLSGDPAALESLGARLTVQQIFNRLLRVNVAYHSAEMDPLQFELLSCLASVQPRTAAVPLYSTVTGARADGCEFDAAYWWRNVREPVEFRSAVDSLLHDGFEYFLEVGPHPVLASSINECLASSGRKGATFCSLRRGEDERSTMLSALASLYTAGLPVRWDAFRSESARFVRLPAYPWQHERHWLESEESVADRCDLTPHPLPGRRANAARPTWELEISTRVLEYLSDHVVRGAVVFPGAGYIEMALAAGREVFGAADFAIEDIRFERALFLTDGERPRVQIALDPETGGFEIHSRIAGGHWVRHAIGRLARPCARSVSKLDAGILQTRCAAPLGSAECYARFTEQGFEYGPAFQKISRIAIGDGEAVGWLDNLNNGGPEYQLHPAVLDACFQVLVGTDPFRSTDGGPPRTYLPVGIDRIAMRRQPSGSMWAWAKLEHRSRSGAKGNIYLCDTDGNVVLSIEGFEVKALDHVEGTLTRDQMDRCLYEVCWVGAPRHATPDVFPEGGRWLVCADVTGVATGVVHQLQAAGAEVVLVRPGDIYCRVDANAFTVHPGAPDHFTRLLAEVTAGSKMPLTGIVHLWNLDAGQRTPERSQELERAEHLGCVSVLHLVQALARSSASSRVWLVTRGAQAIDEADAVAVQQSPVWGLARVIGHQEHIGIWGGIIDLDPRSPSDEAHHLLAEIRAAFGEDQIGFRNGERYVARFQRSAHLKPSLPVRLRPDASYVITGAFGALGLLTARWMVKHGARRLVLMGRSNLPERPRWHDADLRPDVARRVAAVRELESMGATVMAVPIDIADESQVQQFFREFEVGGWPAIRGVIHSAGLVQDQLLLQMDADSFRNVLRPKVRGAWNLHRALLSAPLDFFVLYSSIGSIVAATGQANYASANAFLDALAHHRTRQGLPAISVNWGPWAVGMVTDLNLTEHFAMRGLDVITPEQGMRFLSHVMSQEKAQAAVLSANWRKLFEFQPKVCPMMAHLAAESQSGSAAGEETTEDFLHVLFMSEPPAQKDLLKQHVQELVSRVLRMDRDRVDVSQPLGALGLDSMMATELKNRLELNLHVPVSVLDLLKGVSIAEFTELLLPRLLEENSEIRELLDELEQGAEDALPNSPGPSTLIAIRAA